MITLFRSAPIIGCSPKLLAKCDPKIIGHHSQQQQHERKFSTSDTRQARKTFRVAKGAWGDKPLITEADYQAAKENGQLEDLQYRPIRFCRLYEAGTSMYDHEYENFCNYVMKGGRKDLAQKLMHETFYEIKLIQYNRLKKAKAKIAAGKTVDKTEEESGEIEMNPMAILKQALKNCEPVVVTKKVKRGGATYQVPYPIVPSQSKWFSIKWMINAVLERPKPREKHFPEVMANEILEAYHNRGKVVKRKDDMHRLADANKAFAHYRWG